MTNHRGLIIGAAVLVIAVVIVGAALTGQHHDVGEPFGISPGTDAPPGGACEPFKYRSATYMLDQLVADTETARGAYVFIATSANGFDASAPAAVKAQAATYRAAVDAWPSDHSAIAAPAVRPAAEAIEGFYSSSCDLSSRVPG